MQSFIELGLQLFEDGEGDVGVTGGIVVEGPISSILVKLDGLATKSRRYIPFELPSLKATNLTFFFGEHATFDSARSTVILDLTRLNVQLNSFGPAFMPAWIVSVS